MVQLNPNAGSGYQRTVKRKPIENEIYQLKLSVLNTLELK